MKQKELLTELKNFSQLREYIEELLGQRGIDQRTRVETLLVFEALYNDMLANGISENTMLQVWGVRAFGDLRIKIAFEGSLYVPLHRDADEFDPESKVIAAYAEKVESRYHSGRNHLILTAKRSSLKQTRRNLIALALAVLAYIPIVSLVGKNGQMEIVTTFIYDLEKLFTDAIISVGAPVTFFALLRNLTSMYITAEGNSVMRRLEFNAVMTSITTVVLAIITCQFLRYPFVILYFLIGALVGAPEPEAMNLNVEQTLSEIIDSFVSSSIFEPFESFAPFPIIVLAILTTYALCSAGIYYESIRKVIEGCYVLFSKMLSAVMYTLPLFSFLAMLDVLIRAGLQMSLFLTCLTITLPLGMLVMAAFYSIRLAASGIHPGPFAKRLVPLLRENLIINSTIDAVPFNTRYCVTQFGFNRKRLDEALPALARVNLDGNCFIITLISVMFIVFNGANVNWFDIIVIGVVIFFLSLGAPNQPGSTLIGLLVIISYLQVPEVISLAIFSEAMFGGVLSMTNAAGDIVTIAAAEKREEKKINNIT